MSALWRDQRSRQHLYLVQQIIGSREEAGRRRGSGRGPARGRAAGGDFQSPTAAEVERFKRWLNAEGQYARRRETKGRRIRAGCGQLAGGDAGAD